MSRAVAGYEGRYFEDFSKGERIIHRRGRTVTYQDNLFFTNFLLNTASIHFDGEYMTHTQFGRPILVATMTIGIVCGIASDELRNIAAELEVRNIKMTAPVFDGDTLHVETEVMDVKAHHERGDVGVVVVVHRAYKNNFSELVCEFERELLVYKSGFSPRSRLRIASKEYDD